MLSKSLIQVSHYLAPAAFAAESPVKSIEKYVINVPQEFYVAYPGDNPEFKDGFPTGFGSALTYKGLDEEGNLQFWGISDRGPNGDSCEYKVDGETDASPSKIFPAPEFTPSIALITIRDGEAIVD